MRPILSDAALDTLFRQARSYNRWRDEPVSDVTIEALYELLKWGPTSANCQPGRFLFLKSRQAKERLRPHLMEGNVEKAMTAPVVTIIAYDTRFYERLAELFPHKPEARDWFAKDPRVAEETAFRNSTLQGAYLIMAARALGLDCGPMSGFDNAGVDREFFPEGDVKSNFLCALGYGSEELLFPRGPRLGFAEACRIL
ncbi:MAG: malonic semialdehyde reductase [Alphaproteobacteria bacterium]|nr:MAG: malonic semialdehyde reductase [Alphaproteobacteria bacterium]